MVRKIRFLLPLLAIASLAWGAQQTINVGTVANDGTGDTARVAFGKVNANDTELYASIDALIAQIGGLTSADVGLGNVENTALSTWTGSSNLTTLGTIATGVWDGSTIAITHGGTGAATAALARTGLGLQIGTDVQAWDLDLDTWAAKTAPSGTVVGTTDTQTLTGKTIAGGSNTLTGLSLATAVTGTLPIANGGTASTTAANARTALGLAIGTDVQAFSSNLGALAGLVSAANSLPYFTGSGAAALADFSGFGRSLVDDADASGARTTLGLVIGTNVQAWDADLDTWATKTAPSGTVVGTTDTQTLSGKSISGGTNTLSSIANASLTNSSITINGTATALGGTRSLSLASADYANQGTTTTVLHGNAAGNPSFGAVALAADVSGRLPYANLTQGSALSVLGVTGNGTADVASIAAATDGHVLRRSGTTLAFGLPSIPTTTYGSLPTCNSGTTGQQQYATDVGLMLCDGTTWMQLSSISKLWANRATPLFTGQTQSFTDVGPGVSMVSTGTSSANSWKVRSPTDIVVDTTLATLAGTGLNIPKQYLAPAALLRACRYMRVRIKFAKNGTTDGANSIRMFIGSLGTTSDTQIFTGAGFSSTNRTNVTETYLEPTSATNLRNMAHDNAVSDFSNAATTVPTPLDFTVTSMDTNPTYISAAIQITGGTNSGQVAELIVTLYP